ncbi:hypothetical protein D187_007376 [Cystobacter fuscus DSM 2262]|uniref:Uncharacterized protein n=1 Tax=Cystobacter fuscus (strain ATCC 25194 / DSM 2262 / NBRC 100088 / M29) TaxID=1242864 RepID=S9Q402_CYSF2|nr:hypothetical protein [Cystobacter fuscus]EPX56034.1 hypothetical protein D187_007376 [Cystobacter fuscus DSM 2262]
MREAGPRGGPGLRCTASSLETKPQKGLGREHQGRDHEAPGDTNKLSGTELATKRWEDFSFNGFGVIVSVRILTAPFSEERRQPRQILTRDFSAKYREALHSSAMRVHIP